MNKEKVFCKNCRYYTGHDKIPCYYIITRTKTINQYKIEFINQYAIPSFDNKNNKCKYYEYKFTVIPALITAIIIVTFILIMFWITY